MRSPRERIKQEEARAWNSTLNGYGEEWKKPAEETKKRREARGTLERMGSHK